MRWSWTGRCGWSPTCIWCAIIISFLRRWLTANHCWTFLVSEMPAQPSDIWPCSLWFQVFHYAQDWCSVLVNGDRGCSCVVSCVIFQVGRMDFCPCTVPHSGLTLDWKLCCFCCLQVPCLSPAHLLRMWHLDFLGLDYLIDWVNHRAQIQSSLNQSVNSLNMDQKLNLALSKIASLEFSITETL